jgi:hypothetical protein
MEFVYVLVNGSEWEDMIILLSEEDAISNSIKYPNLTIKVFEKNISGSYTPTYNYYENGKLILK